MSQQHTTQASDQRMLERVFKPCEHGTTARTEMIAGFTAFLTMVYIAFANPQTLGVVGADTNAVFVTAYLITAFGSIMMGLSANLPVTLAPAIGLNAFFTLVVVQAMGPLWQVGMDAIFWGAIDLLLLTTFCIRCWMIANIPVSPRVGITSGIGLFIGMTGLKNAGVIVASPETLINIGNLTSHSVLLGVFGFLIIAVLALRSIHAAVLASIVVATLLGWMLGNVHYNGTASAPPSVMTVVGHVDLAGSLNFGLAGAVFSSILVNLFDSSDTLTGVTGKVGLADKKGKFPRTKQALYVDSISSVTDSFVGIPFVTAYIESSSGVPVGGRTGPTAVVVGLLFLLVIFLSPLAGMVSGYTAAGALIYVGVLVTSSLARVNWQGLTESVPVFITVVIMPSSLSITEGTALGFVPYCVMKIGTGRLRDPSPCVIIVALMFILKIVSIDVH